MNDEQKNITKKLQQLITDINIADAYLCSITDRWTYNCNLYATKSILIDVEINSDNDMLIIDGTVQMFKNPNDHPILFKRNMMIMKHEVGTEQAISVLVSGIKALFYTIEEETAHE